MRIDAGLIIGIALEFVIMLYFANSTLQPKKNYYISSAMCFVGYLIVFAFSLFNQLFVNVGVFIVINLLIFNLGYRSHASTVNDYNGGGKIDIFFIGVFYEKSRQKKGDFFRKIFSVVSGSSYNDFCVFNYGLSAEY